ncbi:MAG: DNA primase [Bacteroidales bacterium]|jgi:DNA primase|nr:DNA primase [Bacteroidales bacterium]
MISKKTVDEILLVSKIEEVVGDFVSLKKRGQNWVGPCPFHDDKNPSMYVSPRLGIFKCFVCEAGGNAVHFLMEHEKIPYPEALRYLAKKYNIAIEEEVGKTPEQIQAADLRESMFILNGYVEKYFTGQLFDTGEGRAVGLSYFKERGYSEATIQKFRLGYNPENWDTFTQEALKNAYSKELLLKLGLTKESENGKLYDFYRGRVIFPIHNTMGKVVGFGGRTLKKDAKIAKYFNSPESEIYHKSDVLYGFYFAKKSIRTLDNVYLVEGYTDVISLSQAGVENVVASSGTALTERQVKLISSQTANITVLYDGDAAGIKASVRGIDMLLSAGMNVKVVLLPEGEDPDSFARSRSNKELLDYLTNEATDFLLFKVKVMSKEAGNDPVKRAEMVTEMIRSVAEVANPIAQAFYIKECAEIFDLPEETLNIQLRKEMWKKKRQGDKVDMPNVINPKTVTPKPEILKINPLEVIEEKIIILILKYGLYEINVEMKDENGEAVFVKKRIDQHVFDEFHEEEIAFSNAMLQIIYEEYAEIATSSNDQDEIRKHFALHESKEISTFIADHLLKKDPAYSDEWEHRFDITTNTLMNNAQKLNSEVEQNINWFKYRILDNHRKFLLFELSQNPPEEITKLIAQKLTQLLPRRKEIADILGSVTTG